jgi:hypothetical protein
VNDHDDAAIWATPDDEDPEAIREVFGPPSIDPGHAAELHQAGKQGATVGPWTLADIQRIDRTRWHDVYRLVVRDEAGDHWGLTYRLGLTEYQEHDLPWADTEEPLTLTRLYPDEVIRVVYRTTPPARGGEPS